MKVFAALCILFALTLSAATAAPDRPQAQAVAPGVWMVQGASEVGSSANRNFISNAAFVVTDDRVVVVDALGSPPLAEELLAEIRRITPLPVRQVIVTHYHADHVYGLQVFKDQGAEIIAHEGAHAYLSSETAALRMKASREDLFPWVDERTHLVPPDRWLTDGATLMLGGTEFRIVHVGPAHSPEDLVVYLPQSKVLLAGDLVFRGRLPFVGQADSGGWVRSLDRLLTFDAEVIVPGHGPISRSPREDLQLTRDYLVYLRQSMGDAARNLDPFEEAYAKADWSRFEHLPLFRAANRINAYNTYLLMEQSGK